MVVVAVIGLVLIAVQGSTRETLLSPGPLTFQHSVTGGCAGCHQGFADGPAGWVKAAFGLSDPGHGDRACHSCHDLGPHAERPHSRPAAALAAVTRNAERRPHDTPPPVELALASWLFGQPGSESAAVGCSTCHREHQGVGADLTRIPAGACQACHAVKFDSFGDGHPPFGATLFDRRQRIGFDHAAHLDRHFSEPDSRDKAPSNCTDCHVAEADGRFMAVRRFEPMCGTCHGDEVAGTRLVGAKGVAFLAVPGLDVREFEARGIDIGDWPRWSEEPVTPFMRRMLDRDDDAAAALRRLDGVDLLDLRTADPDQMRAAADLAMAVKRLVGDLLAGGVDAAAARLSGVALEMPPADGGAASPGALLGHMPREVLLAATRDWFPHLADDLASGLPAVPEALPGPAGTAAKAPQTAPTDRSDILAPRPGGSAPIDRSDILAPSLEGPAAADQSDILAPFAEVPDPLAAPVAPPPSQAALAPPAPSMVEPKVPAEEWMAGGGWYRDEFALLYRPTGHADPFLRAWLDIAAAEPSDESNRLMAVFDSPRAPGACLKCHSVDRPRSGTAVVNWLPAQDDPARRDFVRFSHEPHFSLVAESGCQTCHAVVRPFAGGSTNAFQDQYRAGDPHHGVIAGFAPPTVATCAECHAPGRTGDTCTQCHAYHVGRFATPTVPTRMEVTGTATR